jgi:hypothetical protein
MHNYLKKYKENFDVSSECNSSESWRAFARNVEVLHVFFRYTVRNAEPVAQQDRTMFCCPRCSHLSTILNNVVEPESSVTLLFNIVDSYEQCGQQNIVQSCFHQYCINLSVFTRVVEPSQSTAFSVLFLSLYIYTVRWRRLNYPYAN